jgi:uncharacterized cupin superfamily protein
VVVSKAFGSGCGFEGREFRFEELGINLSVVEPGQPVCLYHSESQQEDFSCSPVSASCSSRARNGRSRPGTSSTCPAGVAHVFVGAGTVPA